MLRPAVIVEPAEPGGDPGAALGRALLTLAILLLLTITWAPFDFAWPRSFALTWVGTPRDLLLNFGVFVPLGASFAAAAGRSESSARKERVALAALLSGALLSALIEAGQLFIRTRYTSLWDVVTNGLGAYFGALVQLTLAAELRRPLPGRAVLRHPLSWLSGALALLLGACALGLRDDRSRALLAAPLLLALALALVGVRRRRPSSELAGLSRLSGWLATLLALYALLLALYPLGARTAPLAVGFGLSLTEGGLSISGASKLLEQLLGLGCLGFTIALGRDRGAPGRVALVSGLVALACELVRGLQAGRQASVAGLILAVAAASIGGSIARRLRALGS